MKRLLFNQSRRFLSSEAKKSSAIDLRGVFPPIVTPFNDKDESIDFGKLKENMQKWNDTKVRG